MESQTLVRPDTTRTALQPLTDSDSVAAQLDTLRRRTVRELRLALPRRPYDRRVRERAALLSAELVRRGARVRVLHLEDLAQEPAQAEDLRRIAASGAQVRALPRLPVWMAVADRDLAIVPSDPGVGGSSATLLRGRLLVAAHHALFDQVWASSAPADGRAGTDGTDGLDEREREALVLLAAGLTDEGISRRTGLSVRTVRRTIAGMMSRMGAQSRFQAGAEAARRQWI
ncbi:helix-turn-helix transcriptional regulator [Streptomyces sp. AC627_RSS907]|uniref:helix-turn-helix transcriptional regulator n=1 Tax=Streptomyces sp. AC627_RSS907 TaxID=2823684 RepID=UPI001C21507D|nr:helix-turn-helix transcriptional regulator [Streptomyces sp. AC627_RSS907]